MAANDRPRWLDSALILAALSVTATGGAAVYRMGAMERAVDRVTTQLKEIDSKMADTNDKISDLAASAAVHDRDIQFLNQRADRQRDDYDDCCSKERGRR